MKLRRYEVVRELGKGAMGIVYLAKDPLIGRLVALKTIRTAAHADDDDSKEFQQRFVREAQAAGILNHPAIVTVHDIGQDEATGVSFIAMEYVEGHNLKEVLSQGRPLSFEQIADIIAQIADALDFAHSKGIVHRDVKPANIILLEGNRAKITDFGIAKIATGVSNLTSTGQFLGTPNYMAPEQIKGGAVDGRTDIFSLGICLYECLTRRKPFGGDSLTSISYKIVHDTFATLHEVNPQIPDAFEEIVATALAKDPARRYQRGRDFAVALRNVFGQERRPRLPDPALAEATLLTKDKIPTIELPFSQEPEQLSSTPPASAHEPTATVAPPSPPSPGPGRADTGKGAVTRPVGKVKLRATLDGVRASPLWKTSIKPAIFFGVIAVVAVVLAMAAYGIRKTAPEVPKVDTFREARVAKQRKLRLDAERALREGRVSEAYAKYAELNKLAPSSDYVNGIMQKLSLIRQQEEITRQQATQARQLFDQGMAFFNNKQYENAIELFQQSFHLNPNDEETARYLKLAQEEDDRQREARLAATRAKSQKAATATAPQRATATTASRGAQPSAANGLQQQAVAPAVITTTFQSPFADGYIMVKVGADVVAHENIYEERRLFRRRVPRAVAVTTPFQPKNADVEIWIVVPSQQINEHKTLRGNFQPAGVYRLIVTADPKAKTFAYQLN